jgi:uncharacterized protein (TIGR00251 family)
MLQEQSGGTVIAVRVTPRSTVNKIEGGFDGRLIVRLTAPPVEGAANHALVKLLSDYFGIARSNVEILSGSRGRNKRVLLRGLGVADVMARLKST